MGGARWDTPSTGAVPPAPAQPQACIVHPTMPIGPKPPPETDCIRVAYSGGNGPTTWTVVHWMKMLVGGPVTRGDLDTLNDDLQSSFASRFVPQLSSDVHFTEVSTRLFLTGGGIFRRATIVDAIGGIAQESEPGQVCFLVDWDTSDARRGGKPRSYLSGVPEGHMTDSAHVSPGAAIDMSTAANNYINDVNAIVAGALSVVEFVDMSFINAKAWRAPHALAIPIFAGHCRAVVGTQRRRVDRVAGG
jgi:hypothetical protein